MAKLSNVFCHYKANSCHILCLSMQQSHSEQLQDFEKAISPSFVVLKFINPKRKFKKYYSKIRGTVKFEFCTAKWNKPAEIFW
jgi:hypothetical protein